MDHLPLNRDEMVVLGEEAAEEVEVDIEVVEVVEEEIVDVGEVGDEDEGGVGSRRWTGVDCFLNMIPLLRLQK